MRTTIVIALLLCSVPAFLPAASADPGLRDCVERDPETGDITVSPSACAATLDPVRQEVYEQCYWIASNPAVPPNILHCVPPQ